LQSTAKHCSYLLNLCPVLMFFFSSYIWTENYKFLQLLICLHSNVSHQCQRWSHWFIHTIHSIKWLNLLKTSLSMWCASLQTTMVSRNVQDVIASNGARFFTARQISSPELVWDNCHLKHQSWINCRAVKRWN